MVTREEADKILKEKFGIEIEKDIKYQYLELISGKEKKWAEATELLVKYILKRLNIYTTKDDLKTEMWVYKNGIYIPHGKSEVKELLREILGEQYSNFVFNSVIAKIEPDTFIRNEDFFSIKNKKEIIVKNGILNIINLELGPFDPKKIFFNKMPIKFDISKKCPKIEKFLKEVLPYKEDINSFLELVGFSLLKEYKFEKGFMFIGSGRNGKGKTISLLKRLNGVENCCSIPLASLTPESFSIAELFGKNLNLAGDIGNQDLKDTSMFKSLTGRDLVGGKRKFLRELYFENYAKFVFACNEPPMVYDLTRGFWDRWILFEFPFTFVIDEEYKNAKDKNKLKIRDEDILNKITTEDEMSGFLNKALEGLNRLLKNKKFSSTKGCEEIKSAWIRRSNSFIAFCYDNIEGSDDNEISKKDLRKKYSKYCKNHKVTPKSDYVIKRVLQDTYGVQDERKSTIGKNDEWFWVGIKWKM